MSKPSVLIVEDEPDIAELIAFHVEHEGFGASVVQSGKLALDSVRRDPPDLIVLDLMLPDLDGLEVCRRLRRDGPGRAVPILIVSARGEESDIVAGLELGADDYVTKPFSPKVLMARVRNILRRTESSSETTGNARRIEMADGHLVLDADRYRLVCEGEPIELTRTEFEILRCLADRPGFVRTRAQIISSMYGDGAVLTSRTIDVHITAIRRKLGSYGRLIETVRGVGYRMSGDEIPSNV